MLEWKRQIILLQNFELSAEAFTQKWNILSFCCSSRRFKSIVSKLFPGLFNKLQWLIGLDYKRWKELKMVWDFSENGQRCMLSINWHTCVDSSDWYEIRSTVSISHMVKWGSNSQPFWKRAHMLLGCIVSWQLKWDSTTRVYQDRLSSIRQWEPSRVAASNCKNFP